MAESIEFDAEIVRASSTGASAFVLFPLDTKEHFGTAGRVPVIATFDGEPYRGSLMRYGGPKHMLIVLAEIQEKIGKRAGDTVHVTLQRDAAERSIDLDQDVADALAAADRLDEFRALSYSHQKEYWQWVSSAKKAETRLRRIDKMIEMLAAGERLR
jgi:Domain of unknown function (DUF1905)/Bacteriocin-protection, YdeI or OmpD-Associated